jgi:acid phosphatase
VQPGAEPRADPAGRALWRLRGQYHPTLLPAIRPGDRGGAAAAAQTAPTIGDRLSAAGVDWAWYSGGWSNANGDVGAPGWTNGTGPTCSDPNALPNAVFPNCPDKLFQFHHQACNLKPVSFIKPVGAENEHPGYASEAAGSSHLIDLLQAVENSRCRKDTMVVVTYDELGGQWDHVSPPGQGTAGPHDASGPGTRLPALVISPFLRGEFVVDHTQYDTTSIIATIERRFDLRPLATRDAAVRALSNVFRATSHGRR